MTTETLLKIVETQLQETSNMKEKSSEFIRKVVHLYTLRLIKGGTTIPVDFIQDVLEDIENDAIEIFRKKTYGYLTLEEYRRHKFKQKNDN